MRPQAAVKHRSAPEGHFVAAEGSIDPNTGAQRVVLIIHHMWFCMLTATFRARQAVLSGFPHTVWFRHVAPGSPFLATEPLLAGSVRHRAPSSAGTELAHPSL